MTAAQALPHLRREAPAQAWPAEGLTRVPLRIYQDPAIYAEEQARIYRGPVWNYLCLEVELPNAGDYKTTFVGEMPVIVARDLDGTLHAFENRCVHRGTLLSLCNEGNARDFTCVYHNWRYDLQGNLLSIAFKRGLKGKGGMPDSFRMEQHGPRKLRVETLAGLVFGTLDQQVSCLEDYIGREVSDRIRRVLRKPLVVLGCYTQVLPNNWKLYFENVKDSYHASLLHVFFTTFKITRLSLGGGIIVDGSGGHHVAYTNLASGGPDTEYAQAALRANREGEFKLADPSLLEARDEFTDGCEVQMLSLFPGFVLQSIQNSLAVRHVLPKSLHETHVVQTYLGFADDDEALRALRIKQANFVGPAGYVSMEDGAVGGFVQRGIAGCDTQSAIVEMGGNGTATQEHSPTEVALRGFWKAYRRYMDLS